MRLLHPRKYWRIAVEQWNLWRFRREAQRCGVQLDVGEGVAIKDSHVRESKFGKYTNGLERKLIIGDHCELYGVMLMFHGYNNLIHICEGTQVNATKENPTSFHVSDGMNIEIGEDSLFSNSIMVSTSDWHNVYQGEERINQDKSIKIGKNVWVGERAYITKGVSIADGSIIGACGVVTKSFDQKHILIAGNPATIKKENVCWTH